MRLRFPGFVRDRPGRENAVSQPPKNSSLAMENDDEPVELQIAHFRMYFQSYFWSTIFFSTIKLMKVWMVTNAGSSRVWARQPCAC